MDYPQDLKPLLVQWLEDEIEILSKFAPKLAIQHGKALENLKKYPVPVKNTKQLLKIQFIGPKIVTKLDKRLLKYCEQNGLEIPVIEEPVPKEKRPLEEENSSQKNKKKKRKTVEKKYVPLRRSGGYAIVLSLLMEDPRRDGLTKDEIVRHATQFCDQSFHSNPSTNQFYSAWSSTKTLINKNLLDTRGRPMRYFLTDEGEELLRLLLQNENLNIGNTLEQLPVARKRDQLQWFEGCGYSVWPHGSYEIKLMLDNREIRSQSQRDYFSTKFTELGVNCSTLALTVGDGLWCAVQKSSESMAVLDFIFERKRLDDLVMSIKDGRYTEQKSRLKKTGINNVFYIVEETMGSDVSMMSDAIQTSILLTMTNSQFYVKRTKDSDDTILLLQKMTSKIEEYYQGRDLIVIEELDAIKTQSDYRDILNQFRKNFDDFKKAESIYRYEIFQDIMSKSDLITVKELYVKMLMTITGVSLDKLIMIQKKFPTPKSLLTAYRNCQTTNAKEQLMLLEFQNEVGNKKIGPLLSKKVYDIWGKDE